MAKTTKKVIKKAIEAEPLAPAMRFNATPVYSISEDLENVNKEKATYKQHIKSCNKFFESKKSSNFASDVVYTSMLGVVSPATASDIVNKALDLRAIITAYSTSTAGSSFYFSYKGKEDDQKKPSVAKELDELTYKLSTLHYVETLNEILRKYKEDQETSGYAFLEIERDSNGEVASIDHVPFDEIMMMSEELYAQPVKVTAYLAGKPKTKIHYKYFKRFVRYPKVGGSYLTSPVYYKEIGSATNLDRNGMVHDTESDLLESGARPAPELILGYLYAPNMPHGSPRWWSVYEAIKGIMKADELNLETLTNGGTPKMALLVSGGGLTDEAMDGLKRAFSGTGNDANRVVVLEAMGDNFASSEAGAVPPPSVKFEYMHDKRQTDAMYQQYTKDIANRILSAYRLNPMILGKIQDVNYSTAEQALMLIEEQIFKPERAVLESIVNKLLLTKGENNVPPKYWEFKIRPTTFMTPDSLVRIMKAAETSGAMTPNVATEILSRHTDMQIEKVTLPWGDYPIDMTKIAMSQGREKGFEEIASPAPIDAVSQTDNKFGNGNQDGKDNSANEILNNVDTASSINTNNISKGESDVD